MTFVVSWKVLIYCVVLCCVCSPNDKHIWMSNMCSKIFFFSSRNGHVEEMSQILINVTNKFQNFAVFIPRIWFFVFRRNSGTKNIQIDVLSSSGKRIQNFSIQIGKRFINCLFLLSKRSVQIFHNFHHTESVENHLQALGRD